MKNNFITGLINSVVMLVYIALVSLVITNGEELFGEMNSTFSAAAFLLLFTLSALVVGVIVLGKPIMLYLDGKKKEAVSLLTITVGYLALFTVIALFILAVK